jgi:hypothetical protein
MGREFLQNISRYCIWLKAVDLSGLKNHPEIYQRIQKVQRI